MIIKVIIPVLRKTEGVVMRSYIKQVINNVYPISFKASRISSATIFLLDFSIRKFLPAGV